MDTKLTLKLDKDVIERAKAHAERHGLSLSRLVENYFAGLTDAEEKAKRPTGLVAELAGILAGAEIEDEKEGYAEYLSRKYS